MHPRSLAVLGTLAVTSLAILARPSGSGAQPGGADQPVALGYSTTLGQSGQPWQRSNAYLNQPWGVGGDRDGVWIANGAGRNLVRFGSGSAEDLGRAGDLDDLYGRPVRFLADVAVVAEGDGGGSVSPPVASPTPTKPIGPRPFQNAAPGDPAPLQRATPTAQGGGGTTTQPPPRTVWFVDQGGHVAVGIPLAPNGVTGTPLVLGETDVAGDDDGHFDGPSGIAADDKDTVFVSDTGNHRVQVLGAGGARLATIGQTGVAGAGAGQLNRPARLALSKDGRLYIADSGNHRVVAYDVRDPRAPTEVQSYGRAGSPGSGSDQFRNPLGVYVDATFLYVADSGNGRVQILQWRDGKPWRTLDGSSPSACAGSGGAWDMPSDVAQDQSGNIYVALPQRMMVMGCDGMSWSARSDLTRGSSDTPYLTHEQLHNAPFGVAVAPDGTTAIVEGEGQRVVVQGADGEVQWTAGKPGVPGAGDAATVRFDGPADAAYLPDGRLVVADAGNGRLVVLGADGSRQGIWGDGTLQSPSGVAVLADGTLAVADTAAGRVRRLDAAGTVTGDLAGPGGPLSFTDPTDVAVDGAGNWYVSERSAHAVRVLDSTGRPVRTLGTAGVPGDDFDHLNQPTGLAVDADGPAAGGGHRQPPRCRSSAPTAATSPPSPASAAPAPAACWSRGAWRWGRMAASTWPTPTTTASRSSSWRPEPWLPAAVNGFGERAVTAVEALAELNGQMYAGLRSATGAAIWRRDGTGPWQQVASGGFGDTANAGVTAFTMYGGQLYAGVENVTENRNPVTRAAGERVVGWRRHLAFWRWRLVGAGGQRRLRGQGPERPGALRRVRRAAVRGYAQRRPRQPRPAVALGLGRRRQLGAGTHRFLHPHRVAQERRHLGPGDVLEHAPGRHLRPGSGAGLGQRRRQHLARRRPAGARRRPAGCHPGPWTQHAVHHRLRRVRGLPVRRPRHRRPHGPPRGAGQRPGGGAVALHQMRRHRLGHGRRRRLRRPQQPWQPGPDALRRAAVPLPVRLHRQPGDGLDVWRATDGLDWNEVMGNGFGDDNNTDPGSSLAARVYQNRLYVGTINEVHGGELWSSGGTRPGVVPTPPGPTATPTPRPSPQPPTGRARYHKVDEWPAVQPAPEDVLAGPIDMAVADDGEVYLLDSGPVRVLRLLPDRTWGLPFGGVGSGPDRITVAVDPASGARAALALDEAAGRVYVSDLGTERLLAFDRQGGYVATVLARVLRRGHGRPPRRHAVDRRPPGRRRAAHRAATGPSWSASASTGPRTRPASRAWWRWPRSPAAGYGWRTRTASASAPMSATRPAHGAGAHGGPDRADPGPQRLHRRATAGPARRRAPGRPVHPGGRPLPGRSARQPPLQRPVRCRTADGAPDGRPLLRPGHLRRRPQRSGQRDLPGRRASTSTRASTSSPAIGRAASSLPTPPTTAPCWIPRGSTCCPTERSSWPTPRPPPPTRPSSVASAPTGRRRRSCPWAPTPVAATASPSIRTSWSPPVSRAASWAWPSYGRGAGTNFEMLIYGQTVRRRYCTNRVCTWGQYIEPIWQTSLVNLNQNRGAQDFNYMATYRAHGAPVRAVAAVGR